MGYLHIHNIKSVVDPIFLFKECYAMEKIHGTSAHIGYIPDLSDDQCLTFFSGGAKHEEFVKIFDKEALVAAFRNAGYRSMTIYGEAYGGKMQKMSDIYGKELKFIAFDVKTVHGWLEVPRAELIVKNLGLEFVYYKKVPVTIEALDAERDAPSEQAIRNGCGNDKIREGIVCRPLMEFSYSQDENSRIICKHKRAEFRETKSVRTIESEEKRKLLEEAALIVDEWCVPMRLEHVLGKMGDPDLLTVERTKEVITNMVEDILREGAGEIVESKLLIKEIGNRTAFLYKKWLGDRLHGAISSNGSS